MNVPQPAHLPGAPPEGSRGPLPTRRADAAEMVVRLHDAMLPVLAAYPIDGFLHDYLAAFAEDDPARMRCRTLLLRLLAQWSELLWRDMGQLPASDDEVVRSLRERMATARQALLCLHDAIEDLEALP